MNEQDNKLRDELLNRAAEILSSNSSVINDQMELIIGVLMILLNQPISRKQIALTLTPELTTIIDGNILDKICAVLNKTYLIKGEKYSIHDDIALELIRDYLLEYDEFIFYKNKKLILRKPQN